MLPSSEISLQCERVQKEHKEEKLCKTISWEAEKA